MASREPETNRFGEHKNDRNFGALKKIIENNCAVSVAREGIEIKFTQINIQTEGINVKQKKSRKGFESIEQHFGTNC